MAVIQQAAVVDIPFHHHQVGLSQISREAVGQVAEHAEGGPEWIGLQDQTSVFLRTGQPPCQCVQARIRPLCQRRDDNFDVGRHGVGDEERPIFEMKHYLAGPALSQQKIGQRQVEERIEPHIVADEIESLDARGQPLVDRGRIVDEQQMPLAAGCQARLCLLRDRQIAQVSPIAPET